MGPPKRSFKRTTMAFSNDPPSDLPQAEAILDNGPSEYSVSASPSGNNMRHCEFARTLSSRSWTLARPFLLLLQVNKGPWNPRSMRPQAFIILLNMLHLFSEGAEPPNFSAAEGISLKTPTMTLQRKERDGLA